MKYLPIILFTACLSLTAKGQNKWFTAYQDTVSLTKDANEIINQFEQKVLAINPNIKMGKNLAIKNTKPYLIFIKNSIVNLPYWEEVIPQQKKFFYEVAGGESEGKEVFGLFFNGFYLVHELGHSFSESAGKEFDNAYDSEYDANKIAIFYYRTSANANELEKCYTYAKKMLQTLTNPVPETENYKEYITKNYQKLASNPYQYGYIQFSQFVEIYESKNLPNFEEYIKNYLN